VDLDAFAQSGAVTAHVTAPLRTRRIDAATVAISGDVDVYSAPQLAAALAEPTVHRVILTAVTFIDAAGLAVLLTAHRSRPRGLTLCCPSRHVVRLLELAGHSRTFPMTNHDASHVPRPTSRGLLRRSPPTG
jgi:anti-anti-sigma factor